MVAVVSAPAAAAIIGVLEAEGIHSWELGTVSTSAAKADTVGDEWVQGAKGVNGGAVRLTGQYR